MDLWAIFMVGLTTGGLSCLAVQGGLLATAMTRQVALETPTVSKKNRQHRARHNTMTTGIQLPKDPWPVVAFLAAKLVAYTLLGLLLGALGSVVQITPEVQAVMQIIAGLFMLATALNMLNVHPIFRYFAIQPPKFLTRLVRNQARSEQAFAPAMLGFMTVLIPCGTTQAMEVLAVSSGSPILGALIMAVFVLGTSPTFFVLGFITTQFRGKLQQTFAMVAALLILILGFVSVDSGLNIIGSPLAPRRITASLFQSTQFTGGAGATRAQEVNGVQEVTIMVGERGYAPNYFVADSGKPMKLVLVTNNTYGCARAFTIPSLGVRKILPDTGRVEISVPAQPAGNLYFSCSMGMYTGVIQLN